MICTHTLPKGEPASADFKISINGMPAKAQVCRVSAMPYNVCWPGFQRPLDQTELASFLSFEMEAGDRAEFVLKPSREFSEVVVRPLSEGIKPECKNGEIRFTIDRPGQYTLELNGHHHALHIFANPAVDFCVDKSDPKCTYYGPGVHKIGKIPVKNGGTVYIDRDAVVYGYIEERNLENIRIVGYGILDNSEEERLESEVLNAHTCAKLYDCVNVTVHGVTFRNPCGWTTICFNCVNVLYDNAKAIGLWRYNSDGFDFVNSNNVVVQNSFARAFDDVIVLKAFVQYGKMQMENYLIKNCVIWCDWGRALEIGAETCTEVYRNIRFTDCDVIHNTDIALDIQNSGFADVSGVLYDNIRVEYSRYSTAPRIQKDINSPYDGSAYLPHLMFAELHDYYISVLAPGRRLGKTHDIVYKDIQVLADDGIGMPPSLFRGRDESSTTTGIRIENLTFNGKRLDTLEAANVKVGKHAEDVVLR